MKNYVAPILPVGSTTDIPFLTCTENELEKLCATDIWNTDASYNALATTAEPFSTENIDSRRAIAPRNTDIARSRRLHLQQIDRKP